MARMGPCWGMGNVDYFPGKCLWRGQGIHSHCPSSLSVYSQCKRLIGLKCPKGPGTI